MEAGTADSELLTLHSLMLDLSSHSRLHRPETLIIKRKHLDPNIQPWECTSLQGIQETKGWRGRGLIPSFRHER